MTKIERLFVKHGRIYEIEWLKDGFTCYYGTNEGAVINGKITFHDVYPAMEKSKQVVEIRKAMSEIIRCAIISRSRFTGVPVSRFFPWMEVFYRDGD